MTNVRTKAFRTLYFYLITAGLPSMICSRLIGSAPTGILCYAAGLLMAFPLSLLPGHIGKTNAPLRFVWSIAVCILYTALSTLYCLNNSLFFLRGAAFGLIIGVLMLFSIRDACAQEPVWTGSNCATIGLVLYAIPGFALMFIEQELLMQRFIWIFALIFLCVTAFTLSGMNMRSGMATRRNARPPKSLVSGNRVLTLIFTGIALLVIFWANLRDAVVHFGKWIMRMILYILYKLTNLFGSNSSSGGAEDPDPSQMFAGFGEAEPSQFWLIMEKVFVVVAILVGVGLVCLALRVLFRLILRLARMLRAYITRFAQISGEDYQDEQVDLFDLDDLRVQAKERLQKTVEHFRRPAAKKWNEMTVRERVRYCVRALYERSGYNGGELRSLTIREAMEKLPETPMQGEKIAELYEKARYSATEPDIEEADALRKAVKP